MTSGFSGFFIQEYMERSVSCLHSCTDFQNKFCSFTNFLFRVLQVQLDKRPMSDIAQGYIRREHPVIYKRQRMGLQLEDSNETSDIQFNFQHFQMLPLLLSTPIIARKTTQSFYQPLRAFLGMQPPCPKPCTAAESQLKSGP